MTLNDMLFAHFNHYTTMSGMLLSKLYGRFKNAVTDVILTLLKCIGLPLVSLKITGNSTQSAAPTPDTPIDILSTGDLVTSADDDWNTPIAYGKPSWVGTAPSALGVDCYRATIGAYPVNIFDSANLTDDDRTYYNSVSISPLPTGTRVTTMGASMAPSSRYRLFLIPKSGGTLYVSFNATTTTGKSQSSMLFYKGNYDGSATTILKSFFFIIGSGKSTSFAMTYDASQPYLHVHLYAANDGTMVTAGTYTDYTNFQMSLISGAAYQPYREPYVYNIYLDAPLRYGDTLDNAGLLTRKQNSVTFDGTEPCRKADGTAIEMQVTVPAAKLVTAGGSLIYYKCSHAPSGSGTEYVTIFNPANPTTIEFRKIASNWGVNYETADWQAFLASSPVTVEYELATPASENITMPAQIETFPGTTLIQLDTKVQPAVMEAEYWSTEEA